jgi:ABC-type Fe3+ transport system substrate-binding protein
MMTIRGGWLIRMAACCLVALAACGPGAGSSAPAASGSRPAPAAPSGAGPASGGATAAQPGAAAPAQPGAAAPARSPALQALVDGARQEGSLSFVWGAGTVGGTDGIRQLAEGLNRHYGLNLNVRFTPGPSMPAMAARVSEEYQAGRPATTDVFVGYGGWIALSRQADALLPVDWASWAPNIQDPRLVAAGGSAIAFQSGVQGITYNTQRVRPDEVPTSLQDLLKPQYKGRIASTPYAAGFDRLPVPEFWGEARTLEYANRFADQITGLIRCNETERVASGEFDIFALDCNQANALNAKANGAPIGFVMASDAPFHPNAAKLWVDYLLSREVQDLLYEFDRNDYHVLPGSKTAADMAIFAGPNLKPVDIGVDFYEKNDEKELARVRTEIERIFAKR